MSSSRVTVFGQEVRRRREARGMTLAMLAEASGLTQAYLNEVELPARRKRGVSLEVAFQISDGLGVELPELLGYKGLSGTGLEAGRLVSSFRPRMRRAVMALLVGIAKQETR
ncbi:MAG TPA: helix-turn-helix transcriptional regulator [Polyangiaceae bacterium]|nr:helix-turn-helix transcriptional regulator [Polyangiaceae bacterium]